MILVLQSKGKHLGMLRQNIGHIRNGEILQTQTGEKIMIEVMKNLVAKYILPTPGMKY